MSELPNPDATSYTAKNVVSFSQENPVLVTGDEVGDLNVYRLYGYDDYSRDKEVQRQDLIKILYPTGYDDV